MAVKCTVFVCVCIYVYVYLNYFFPDTPRYPGMMSELDCWMEWIDNQMADELYEPQSADDFEEFIGGVNRFLHAHSYDLLSYSAMSG